MSGRKSQTNKPVSGGGVGRASLCQDMLSAKASADLPPVKASADLSPVKASASLLPAKTSAGLPHVEDTTSLLSAKANAGLPPVKASASQPQFEASANMALLVESLKLIGAEINFYIMQGNMGVSRTLFGVGSGFFCSIFTILQIIALYSYLLLHVEFLNISETVLPTLGLQAINCRILK